MILVCERFVGGRSWIVVKFKLKPLWIINLETKSDIELGKNLGAYFSVKLFLDTILGNFKRRLRPLGRQSPRQEGLHYSPVADLGRPQAGAEEQRDPYSRIKDIIPQGLLTGKFCIFWICICSKIMLAFAIRGRFPRPLWFLPTSFRRSRKPFA